MAEWDQQPDEPDKWYARFLIYRNLWPDASVNAAFGAWKEQNAAKRLQKTAENRGKLQRPPSAWYKAERTWRWGERAKAYHQEQRRQRETLAKAAVEEAALTLRQAAPVAAKKLKANLMDLDGRISTRAAENILDRAGVPRVTRQEAGGQGIVDFADIKQRLISRLLAADAAPPAPDVSSVPE